MGRCLGTQTTSPSGGEVKVNASRNYAIAILKLLSKNSFNIYVDAKIHLSLD